MKSFQWQFRIVDYTLEEAIEGGDAAFCSRHTAIVPRMLVNIRLRLEDTC
jgi:hypothetical protein